MTYTQPENAQVYCKLYFLLDNYCDHVGTLSHNLGIYFVFHVLTELTSVLPVVVLLYVRAASAVYQERLHQCWQAGVETDHIELLPSCFFTLSACRDCATAFSKVRLGSICNFSDSCESRIPTKILSLIISP